MLCTIVLKNKYCAYKRVFIEWENTHMIQISVDNHIKEGGYKEELLVWEGT